MARRISPKKPYSVTHTAETFSAQDHFPVPRSSGLVPSSTPQSRRPIAASLANRLTAVGGVGKTQKKTGAKGKMKHPGWRPNLLPTERTQEGILELVNDSPSAVPLPIVRRVPGFHNASSMDNILGTVRRPDRYDLNERFVRVFVDQILTVYPIMPPQKASYMLKRLAKGHPYDRDCQFRAREEGYRNDDVTFHLVLALGAMIDHQTKPQPGQIESNSVEWYHSGYFLEALSSIDNEQTDSPSVDNVQNVFFGVAMVRWSGDT
jgi:hypothetical protein